MTLAELLNYLDGNGLIVTDAELIQESLKGLDAWYENAPVSLNDEIVKKEN